MLAIVLLGIFGLVAILGGIGAFASTESDAKAAGFGALGFGLIAFAVTWIFSAGFYVEARTVAIITEFGKPVGTAGPGLNWAAPWKEVTDFPTSSQVLDYDNTDGSGNPVSIKFKGGTTGALHSNQNWSVMSDDKATKLWENWREFEKVTTNVVDPTMRSVTAKVMGDYTPTEAVKGENLTKIDADIQKAANEQLADYGIKVEKVLTKRVDPDPEAQAQINRQNALDAQLKATTTEAEIAGKQAETNARLERSLTPEILAQNCLDILKNWDQGRQGQFPAWNPCVGNLPQIPIK